MPEPIIEQIAVKIKTKLQTITIANGYSVTVKEVVRPTRLGKFDIDDMLVVMSQGDPVEDEGKPLNHDQWRQPFYLDCLILPSDSSTTPSDTLVNRFRSDVEKAMVENSQWDGLAIDTDIQAPLLVDTPDGTAEGIRVIADVIYRTLAGNPYAQ